MTNKCPFYYKLEEVFVSRAGIKATSTSDEVFDLSGDGDDDESKAYAFKTPAKRAKKVKAKSSGKKAKVADDEFEVVMTEFIKDTLHRNRVQNTTTAKAVALAEDFKRMSDALGSKIKAAYACKSFVQFLDKEEKRLLKEYVAEQESSDLE